MRPKVENIFEGRWDIIRSEYYTEDGRWELYNQFEDGEYWWEFLPDELLEKGSLLRFESRVFEHNKGYEIVETTYCYDIDSDDHALIIDRSTDLEDGFMDICEEEWYSLEEIKRTFDDRRSLYLNLTNEPDCTSPYFRLLLATQPQM